MMTCEDLVGLMRAGYKDFEALHVGSHNDIGVGSERAK
jgi:hypothetical protein